MTQRVEVEPLLPGNAGVDQTVAKITRLIREGAANPVFIERAREIVRRARPGDTEGEWREIWDFATGLEAFPYRFDPVDTELLHSATAGLGTAGEDCDGFTVLCGALFESLGYPTTVEVAGTRAPLPGQEPRFHHVYVRAYDPRSGRWKTFDPVLNKPGRFVAAPGMELKAAVRKDYPVNFRTIAKQIQVKPIARAAPTKARPVQVRRTMQHCRSSRPVRTVSPLPSRVAAAPVAAVRRSSVQGYDESEVIGFSSGLGGLGDLGFSFSDITNAVKKYGRKLDPTAPENTLLRSIVGAIPVVGSTIISGADAVAGARKAIVGFTGVDPAKILAGAASPPAAPAAPAALQLMPIASGMVFKRPAAGKPASKPNIKLTGGIQASVLARPASPGMSTGLKIGLAVGGAGLLAGGTYLALRK
jgi:hypothetical protein